MREADWRNGPALCGQAICPARVSKDEETLFRPLSLGFPALPTCPRVRGHHGAGEASRKEGKVCLVPRKATGSAKEMRPQPLPQEGRTASCAENRTKKGCRSHLGDQLSLF